MLLDRSPDFFEMDMDLRAEKEKQRSVMLKLREISGVDPEFSSMCLAYLEKLGFNIPALNRLTTPGMTGRGTRSRSTPGRGGVSDLLAWGANTGNASMFRDLPRTSQSDTTNANQAGGIRNTVVVEVQPPKLDSNKQETA